MLIPLALSFAATLTQDVQSPIAPQVAVKEVFLAPQVPGNEVGGWLDLSPMGDFDRDGRADFVQSGYAVNQATLVVERIRTLFSSSPSQRLLVPDHPDKRTHLFVGGGHGVGGVIRAKDGSPWLVGKTFSLDSEVFALDLLERDQEWLFKPSSVPGFGDRTGLAGVISFSDVNQDGWDEIAFTGSSDDSVTGDMWFIAGLIDGRTRTTLWQVHFDSDGFFPPCEPRIVAEGERPDFDGDGVPDLVTGHQLRDLSFHYLVLSGADGSLIWEYIDHPAYRVPARRTLVTHDLSGDGVRDVLSCYRNLVPAGFEEGEMILIDGASGKLIWSTPLGLIEDFVRLRTGQDQGLSWSGQAVGITPSAKRIGEFSIWVLLRSADMFAENVTNLFVEIDAKSGTVSATHLLPKTLNPWVDALCDDRGVVSPSELTRVLGDIDGDGHTEFARVTYVDPRGGIVASQKRVVAIYSQRSLFVSASVRRGSEVDVELYIPGQPTANWKMLASQSFDVTRGAVVNGWRIGLVPDAVFHASVSRGIVGLLDSDGRSSAKLQVPRAAHLQGTQLFLRALVVDPSQPNRIATMSTLSVMDIE